MDESKDTIIIADSSSELPDDYKAIVPIIKVPFHVITEIKDYIDNKNLNLKELINDIKNSKSGAKSACPSPNDFLDAMSKFKNLKNIFIVTLSSKLSGSYNSAELSKNLYESEDENENKANILVIDSEGAAATETNIILKLNELIKDEKEKFKEINFENIKNKILNFRDNLNTYFVLESYENFVKNGRISKATALLGNALHIVPVMKGNHGQIESAGKARGINKALNKLVSDMKENIKDDTNRTLVIAHCFAERNVETVLEFIKNENIKFKEIVITKTEGLSSMYAEEGGVIVSY